jgi:S1-C subfamily serine protease
MVGDCVAIEFVTHGCPQCRAMEAPIQESLRQGWAIRQVDVARDPFTAQRWRIHSTPTTLLIRDGREIDRILGPVSWDELQRRMMSASSRISPSADEGAPARATPGRVVPTSSSFSLQPITKRSTPSDRIVESQPLRGSDHDSMDLASRATVRIRVDDPTSQAVGTGTIIHTHQNEALVITCGHLFRGLGQNANIQVELFDRGTTTAHKATLIHYEAADKDIGLISFHTHRAVACAPISSMLNKVAEGDRVSSFGCDHGSDPTRRDSRITKLNRYLGAPNIEVAGIPVQGRSGGGLFNEQGELIGICNAADSELDEGLYASLEVIHAQVAQLGLGSVLPSPSPTRNAPSQEMTLIVRDRDGSQREVQIQDPSPALLQALEREGLVVAR